MNRAKAWVWSWRLLVAVTAVLFASLMLPSYLGILGYAFHENQEADYRSTAAAHLAAGDIVQAQRWKERADFEKLVDTRGRFGVAACLSSLAVFVAAVWVKRRACRPAAVRTAGFLTRSMSLGFWLSIAALIIIYAAVIAFVLLTDD